MMSGIDNKKAKRRKVKKGAVTKAATPTKSLTNSEVPLTRAELTGEVICSNLRCILKNVTWLSYDKFTKSWIP